MDIKKEPEDEVCQTTEYEESIDIQWRMYKEEFAQNAVVKSEELDIDNYSFCDERNQNVSWEKVSEVIGHTPGSRWRDCKGTIKENSYFIKIEEPATKSSYSSNEITSTNNNEMETLPSCSASEIPLSHVKLHAGFKKELTKTEISIFKDLTTFIDKPIMKSNFSSEIFVKEAVVKLPRVSFYENTFVCDICYGTFSSSAEQKLHKIVTHDSFTFNSKKQSSGSFQKEHQNYQDLFKCGSCEFACEQSSRLKTHLKTHSGEKMFICKKCDYKCTQYGMLRAHRKIHFSEKPLKCEECDYTCRYSSRLKVHKLGHFGEKPFRCDVCNFSSAHSTHLKTHKMIHTGEKPFKCGDCNYACISASNLKAHKMTHTGVKPFKCDKCDYSCTYSTRLKLHKMIHSTEKPLKCDECFFSCIQICHLKTHKMTHSGEKPFKCEDCDFSFSRLSNLKAHKKTRHQNKIKLE